MNEKPQKGPPPITWWIVWAVFLIGVVQIYYFLGRKDQVDPTLKASNATWLRLFPFTFSCLVRWLILPRLKYLVVAFPVFIIGIAFAEMSLFFGLFLFPGYRLELFVLAIIGIGQFAPYFTKRFYQ